LNIWPKMERRGLGRFCSSSNVLGTYLNSTTGGGQF